MAPDTRKRHVVSYENMAPAVAEAFAQKYPGGFNDYLQDLTKYTKPDGTPFYAVTIDIPDGIYLVKINVKIDDAEDIERWLESEEAAENEQVAGQSADAEPEGTPLPDDNIAQYSSDDDGADGD